MSPAETPKISRSELAVLQGLWELGWTTVRELTERIYPDGGFSNYATVQKLLERLEHKGVVERDRSRRAHRFRATVNQDDYLGDRLQALADAVCGGSFTPLLTRLVSTGHLSSEERESLQRLLAELVRDADVVPGEDDA